MKIRALTNRWHPAAWRRALMGRKVVILLYHRVADVPSDPWSLAVTPRHFAEQLDVVRCLCRPLRLSEAIAALERGTLPRRTVVVTFDDGYTDNLEHAQPFLAKRAIPATFFLTTGALGSTREYWWDELERILLQPGTLPERLCLQIDGTSYTWSLERWMCYSAAEAHNHQTWRAWHAAPTARHRLYTTLWQLLHPLPHTQRQMIMDELLAWAGMEAAGRPSHGTLNWNQVRALSGNELVEIGAHTVTHSSLARQPIADQRDELEHAKAELEQRIGRPVQHFSYPYGKSGDYTRETLQLVRQTGYRSACANITGHVERTTPRYELPRLYVHNWDRKQFLRQLWRQLCA